MKRILITLGVVCSMSLAMMAQHGEVGIGVGVSHFMGDLGKHESKGGTYFHDLEGAMVNPATTVFYRHTLFNRLGLKGAISWTQLKGDDSRAVSNQHRDPDWYRKVRNLHFRSNVIELSAMAEFNILPWIPGHLGRRFTPYVTAGVSAFYFNPKAEYNGEWVALQPLGTEGQGLPERFGVEKYDRISVAIPLGLGFKYNINEQFTASIEVAHRITFTDHIDDVSGVYVNRTWFDNNYDAATAEMAYNLSNRIPENDPEGAYQSLSEAGAPRGNPATNDSWLMTTVSVSYRITKAPTTGYRGCPDPKRKYKRF